MEILDLLLRYPSPWEERTMCFLFSKLEFLLFPTSDGLLLVQPPFQRPGLLML